MNDKQLIEEAETKLSEMLTKAGCDLETFLKSNKCSSKHQMIMRIMRAFIIKKMVKPSHSSTQAFVNRLHEVQAAQLGMSLKVYEMRVAIYKSNETAAKLMDNVELIRNGKLARPSDPSLNQDLLNRLIELRWIPLYLQSEDYKPYTAVVKCVTAIVEAK